MVDWNKFSWEGLTESDVKHFHAELEQRCYEKIFEVEKNDIVLDIGAFYGAFTYSILDKKPKHCWCIEPVDNNFKVLKKNLMGYPVSFVRGAISNHRDVELFWEDNSGTGNNRHKAPGLNFKTFIADNCIDNVDFMKMDCEGGEYLVFTEENVNFLKNNVKKIACEFHLDGAALDNTKRDKNYFRYFRDNILTQFKNYKVYSYDYCDIKWDLFTEHFLDYYTEIYIYIDNR